MYRLLQVPLLLYWLGNWLKRRFSQPLNTNRWKVTTLGTCYLESASSSISCVFSVIADIGP